MQTCRFLVVPEAGLRDKRVITGQHNPRLGIVYTCMYTNNYALRKKVWVTSDKVCGFYSEKVCFMLCWKEYWLCQNPTRKIMQDLVKNLAGIFLTYLERFLQESYKNISSCKILLKCSSCKILKEYSCKIFERLFLLSLA